MTLLFIGCESRDVEDSSITPSSTHQAENIVYSASSLLKARPMLVIRLQYTDKTFTSDETVWHDIMFGLNKGELNHYYREISDSQFEFNAVGDAGNVSNGVVTISHNYDHLDPDIDGSNFENILHTELKNAIETVSTDGFDFSIYDNNSDGDISRDELIITFIMAGEEDAYSGGTMTEGVWAHEYCTSSGYTPQVDNVSVMGCNGDGNYAIFGERHHDTATKSHNATIGIIAHELGHTAFNLPDLYYGGSTRIGYYGLMANGSWGQSDAADFPGSSPTHMIAWSKIDVGWYTPNTKHSDSDTFITLSATGESDYSIIKTPLFNSTDEYFLIENRGEYSYDAGLKFVKADYQGGIAIWHIDDSVILSNRESNTINSSAAHKGIDLEEAAGLSADYGNGDPVLNLYYSNNVSEFTPNTAPNTNLYSGDLSYLFITDISSRSTSMSFKINNPTEQP